MFKIKYLLQDLMGNIMVVMVIKISNSNFLHMLTKHSMELGAFQRVILFIQMIRGMCLCCFYVYVYQTFFCYSFFQNFSLSNRFYTNTRIRYILKNIILKMID